MRYIFVGFYHSSSGLQYIGGWLRPFGGCIPPCKPRNVSMGTASQVPNMYKSIYFLDLYYNMDISEEERLKIVMDAYLKMQPESRSAMFARTHYMSKLSDQDKFTFGILKQWKKK